MASLEYDLDYIMDELNLDERGLARILGCATKTIYRWKEEANSPNNVDVINGICRLVENDCVDNHELRDVLLLLTNIADMTNTVDTPAQLLFTNWISPDQLRDNVNEVFDSMEEIKEQV